MIAIDPHTHTVASGHYTTDTLREVALAASRAGLFGLGNTEHGPAMLGAATASYFRSLPLTGRIKYGVRLFFGAELNILDATGRVDLDEDTMRRLDYCIASLHVPCCKPMDEAGNTAALVGAMRNPFVSVIGHPNDVKYPVDLPALVATAKETGTLLELNETSLLPGGYRGDNRPRAEVLLRLCRQAGVSVVLSSDSHGGAHVGDVTNCELLLKKAEFPDELVANRTLERFLSQLKHRR